jgi:hypothetical protein
MASFRASAAQHALQYSKCNAGQAGPLDQPEQSSTCHLKQAVHDYIKLRSNIISPELLLDRLLLLLTVLL